MSIAWAISGGVPETDLFGNWGSVPIFPLYIGHWIQASVSSLSKTRNILLLVAIAIIVGSYFLGFTFPAMNAALFLVLAFRRISKQTKVNIQSDIHAIMRLVNKWNAIDHSECERFCSQEQPMMLQTIYKVVTEE